MLLPLTTYAIHSKRISIRKHTIIHKGNYPELRKELDIDWETELHNKSTTEAWTLFRTKFAEAVRKHIPRTHPNAKLATKKSKWMIYKALTRIKKKHKTWQRYTETLNGEQYRNFARHRNQAKNEIRKSIKMYEKNIAKEAKETPPTPPHPPKNGTM